MSMAGHIRALALGVLAVLGAGPAAAQEVLRLATQVLPPYQMIVDGEIAGVAVRRVQCALDAMGTAYEIRVTDWSKAQLGTETGEYDGFFVGSANAARARYATPAIPVISEDLAWYMATGTEIDPNDPSDALRARYSAKFATSKWLNLKRGGYNVVKKPQDAASLLNMLMMGEIDVALEYEMIFEHFMRERGIEADWFRKIPLTRQNMSVHFSNAFLRANPLFLERFNTEMATCVETIR